MKTQTADFLIPEQKAHLTKIQIIKRAVLVCAVLFNPQFLSVILLVYGIRWVWKKMTPANGQLTTFQFILRLAVIYAILSQFAWIPKK